MAWIDDRIWCHPKFTDLSDRAAWTWVKGVAYSTGFSTHGRLTPGQQKKVDSDARIRRELVAAGLWDEIEDGAVLIHDWDEHNSKRDARREADRKRKRDSRAKDRVTSNGASTGQSTGRGAVPARVDGSEGSDGRSKAVRGRADLTVIQAEQPRADFQIPETLVREMP